eukprot:102071-Chlamydomonas_euryale.AAC.1
MPIREVVTLPAGPTFGRVPVQPPAYGSTQKPLHTAAGLLTCGSAAAPIHHLSHPRNPKPETLTPHLHVESKAEHRESLRKVCVDLEAPHRQLAASNAGEAKPDRLRASVEGAGGVDNAWRSCFAPGACVMASARWQLRGISAHMS